MFRVRASLVTAFALFVGAVGAVFACGSSASSDTLIPITGIVVRSETLTTGRGCGTDSTQIFKYVAVVFGLNTADVGKPVAMQRRDEFLAANVNDCYADGLFVNLPLTAGSTDYDVQVYVYTRTAYEMAGGDAILKGIALRLQYDRVNLLADGGGAKERTAIQSELAFLHDSRPTWTTTCTASQFDFVQTLAVCKDFSLGTGAIGAAPAPATVELSAASFPVGDGGTVKCGVDYQTVRYRSSTGNVFSEPTVAPCASLTIRVAPAVAPASYAIDVALIRADDTVLGQTSCGADTSPGRTSTAVCKPLP